MHAPKVGEIWPGQGGVYAGIIRDGNRRWHLILAITDDSKIRDEWGGYRQLIEGEFSVVDGEANTALLLKSEHDHPIAKHCAALEIDGHKDFYWPARKENNLIEINLPEYLDPVYHWSSTQDDADSAWTQGFEDGRQNVYDKDYKLAARAVRRILVIE